jgi:DNA polymerase III subunit gamma/tau
MFYTKYRPRKFADFLGNQSLINALKKALFSKNFPHAYFLYGPRGIGKTTLARLIAKSLNCVLLSASNLPDVSPSSTPDPCGSCRNCIAVDNGSFSDLIEIDAASNRGVEDIRALRDKAALAPAFGNYKIYIIDEVHMLTTEAFNALLKTLEEPPKHAVFILCTTEFKKVPETIRSRCQKFGLEKPQIPELVAKLKNIIEQEQKEGTVIPEISDKDLGKIAKASLGGFRDSETMLEQVVFGDISVEELLLSLDAKDLSDLINQMFVKNSLSDVIKSIDVISKKGISAEAWADGFLEYLRDAMYFKAGIEMPNFDSLGLENISINNIMSLITALGEAKKQIKYATIPFLPLQVALLDIVSRKLPNKGKNNADSESVHVQDFADGSGNRTKSNPNAQKDKSNTASGHNGLSGEFSIEKLYEAVRPQNHSVEALLRSCRILGFDEEDNFVIEAYYSFHKERLNSPTNKKIVENALEKILGKSVPLKVVLSEKNPKPKEDLSDKNILATGESPQKIPENKIKDAWEVLDGKVPV